MNVHKRVIYRLNILAMKDMGNWLYLLPNPIFFHSNLVMD